MRLSNKRTLSVTLFLIAGIIISVAATKPGNAKVIAANESSDTGFFKNLKVLPKDISKEKLDMIMDHFKEALGVKCGFCHAFDTTTRKMNFASDAKEEKDIARYMMKMTSEINMKYFNSENSTKPDTISVVRCITCHHGNPHPDEAGMMMNNEHPDMPMSPNGAPPPPPPPGMPPPNDSIHQMAPPPPNQ